MVNGRWYLDGYNFRRSNSIDEDKIDTNKVLVDENVWNKKNGEP